MGLLKEVPLKELLNGEGEKSVPGGPSDTLQVGQGTIAQRCKSPCQ